MSDNDDASQPLGATLPRRMTRHLALGPQLLSENPATPMARYHVEENRGGLELEVEPELANRPGFQWSQNGTPIPAAHSARLVLSDLVAGDTDIYFAAWDSTGDAESDRSQSCLVVVVPGLTLTDQSARALVTPDHPFIVGFVIGRSSGSTANRRYLLRVLGPALAQFEVPDGLAKPKVSLFRRGKPCDHLWQTDADFAATWSPRVGAFALSDPEEEFVASAALPAGHYTLHVESSNGQSGQVLVEIYQTTA